MQRAQTDSGYQLQVFNLVEGKVSLTTGTHTTNGFLCWEDGDITLDGWTETISCEKGDVLFFERQEVTIVSGTFHLA